MRYNNWLSYQYLATPQLANQYLDTPKRDIQLAAISIFNYTPKRYNNWLPYQYLATPLK